MSSTFPGTVPGRLAGTLHVVGAGLAGLSTALHAASAGRRVVVWEGSRQAGGRCRSWFDPKLGATIDNGNHLVLSGNRSVARYLALAGSPDALEMAPEAAFPFVDLASAERWTVRINDGPIPWWPLVAGRRPKGVGLGAFLRSVPLLWADRQATIAEAVGATGPALSHFWEPMAFAVLNLPPSLASARLMAATAREAWRDGRLCRPMFAPRGLGEALVAPAIRRLATLGAEVRFGAVAKAIERAGDRVTGLSFADGSFIPLGPADDLVLAVPPPRLNALLPEARAPEASSSILNAHFRLPGPVAAPRILGVIGGRTQWIFAKGEILSLTISAAEHVEGADADHEALLDTLWMETRAALALSAELRPIAARIVHERRATFRQTPDAVANRPNVLTSLTNLVLAGDAIETGLPATIEGAVRSGETAARILTRNAIRETTWTLTPRPRRSTATPVKS